MLRGFFFCPSDLHGELSYLFFDAGLGELVGEQCGRNRMWLAVYYHGVTNFVHPFGTL